MNIPIILGKPFFATAGILIDVQEGKLLSRMNGETMIFNLSNGKRICSINFSLENSQVTTVTYEME